MDKITFWMKRIELDKNKKHDIDVVIDRIIKKKVIVVV